MEYKRCLKEKLPVRVGGILDMTQPVWAKQKQERVTLLCRQEDVDSGSGSLWLVPTPPDCLTSRQLALPAGWGWLVAKQPNANLYSHCEGRDFTISATSSAVPLFFFKMSNSQNISDPYSQMCLQGYMSVGLWLFSIPWSCLIIKRPKNLWSVPCFWVCDLTWSCQFSIYTISQDI